MCGICGISHSDNRKPERALLETMNASIAHRGPDSGGFHIDAGVGLAMRRLAIIDVSGGDQPIANETESVWIVFNGECYNYPEMRAELERRGHRLATKSDTECIVHFYEDEGIDCVKRLRGMFAFALWDENKKRLLLVRDRLGKKPMYYTVQDGTLYFGSELSAVLTALPHKPEIDLEALDLYLSLQYVPDPLTIYQGIRKLPPAHTLVWENGQIHLERYWDYTYQPKWNASEDELIEELRARLREAVKIRLLSERPLGAHLSGGIDSSIIVALMSEFASGPVKTFSAGFEEQNFTELPYARAVAEKYATDHHEFTLTYGDIPATLKKIACHFGEPFADASAIPLYHLSMLTREHVTVALNGDGGDENFAGYQRYWLDGFANAYARAPRLLTRSLIPSIANLLPDNADRPVGQSVVSGIKRLEQIPEIDRRASILRWGSYFSPKQRASLWKPEFRFDSTNAQNLLAHHFDSADGSYLDKTLYTDLHTYLPGDLLVKADRMTMAASLEGRSPFLDHELVEWSARVPDQFKVKGRSGKYLLKKAFARELPDSLKGRAKQGFGIPLSAWFRGPLLDWSKQILLDNGSPLHQWFERDVLNTLIEEHVSARVDHGKRLYALAMLGMWAKQ
ncbi:MAG: asparagine synthase (glutamine-hydrolyzing) [Anaerolineales bacterium]|nr:MAG: asparagine synthase (glutamine-hydrolyzing) [Anaerolineales bacterium]